MPQNTARAKAKKDKKAGTVREARAARVSQSPYKIIKPNSVPQEKFLGTDADIAVYGGSNGGGKTFALLMEACRHLANSQFAAVIFRRTRPELTQPGGAWDKSCEIYPGIGGIPAIGELKWYFMPSGATVKMAAIQHEKDVNGWDSSQIALILIDQAEQFSAKILWALISRNRSTSGVVPYIRMGCNPDPDCFLAGFLSWWIGDDGYAIPERSGVVRWFIAWDQEIIWGDSKLELMHAAYERDWRKKVYPLSVTFVVAKLSDNVDLERDDPSYRAKLSNLPWQERLQKLGDDERGGNWRVKLGAGMFNEFDWRIIDGDYYPNETSFVRWWDCADTEGDGGPTSGAATASVLIGFDREGPIVLDVTEDWLTSFKRDNRIINVTKLDRTRWGHVVTWFEQEGAGGGKRDAERNMRLIEGYVSNAEVSSKNKIVTARAWASAVQARRVRILNRGWTKGFIDQHSSFPLSKRMDLVDAACRAYNKVIITPASDGGTGIYDGGAVGGPKGIIEQFSADVFA